MRRFLVLVAAAGEQTDTFRGTKTTFDFTHEDTGGSPKVPGHYSTSEILGISPPPGPGRPDPGRMSAREVARS
jgi:hypothetical protein